MGIGDFFKKRFGKQVCAFCGQEVGMLKRDKIKNDEFICHDCRHGCSQHIQVYRYTKDELLGHMEYMKRQAKLYEMLGNPTRAIPSATNKQSLEFFDDAGMFRIKDWDADRKYVKELFRYDQVAKYEPYLLEDEPTEQGKPKVYKECGVDITLVGGNADLSQLPNGLRAHPYITNTIRVCVNDRDKHQGELEVNQIIHKFDAIFGVGDDTKGMFSFGPTKQQKRERESMKAMTGMFTEAIKVAKNGGEVSEESVAKFNDAMTKAADAETRGLSKYSKLADEAEAKI